MERRVFMIVCGRNEEGIWDTSTGRPLGSEKFVRDLERKLNRSFAVKSTGRPKKKE